MTSSPRLGALFEELEQRRDGGSFVAARRRCAARATWTCSTGWSRPRGAGAPTVASAPEPARCCRRWWHDLAQARAATPGRSTRQPATRTTTGSACCAKRARYAAEAVAPALGGNAAGTRALRGARGRRPGRPGELQDSVVAARRSSRWPTSSPHDGPFNLAAGRMLEREAAGASARAAIPAVWKKLDRPKCGLAESRTATSAIQAAGGSSGVWARARMARRSRSRSSTGRVTTTGASRRASSRPVRRISRARCARYSRRPAAACSRAARWVRSAT